MGINITAPLPPELQVETWNQRLRVEAVLEDVFTMLRGVYTTSQRREIGNDVYLEISGEAAVQNSRVHTMVLHKTLSGAPTEGSLANQVGNEEDLLQKVFSIYYTDWSHAVSLQSYGIEKNTKDYFKIFERINPDFAIWIPEQEGKYIRESLLERYSQNLTQAPHFLAQEFSPNIAIAGLHSSQWPVFNVVPATWTNAIATGLVAAGIGAQASATIRFYQLIEHWASAEKIIEPVMVGNKETYLCPIPSPQARYLKDPINAGGLGTSGYQNTAYIPNQEDMAYPGVIARIGRCLLIEDPRYPTLTIGGSAGNYSLTPQYRLPGRDEVTSDPRDKTLEARQVGWLLGRAAVAKWQPEPWHYEWEYDRYNKFGGKGVFNSSGFQMVQWDYGPNNINAGGPPTNLTRQQDSSVVCIFSNPPLLT